MRKHNGEMSVDEENVIFMSFAAESFVKQVFHSPLFLL